MEYLSATACRKTLIEDAYSIVKVHAFLIRWGLINFEVDESSLVAIPSKLAQVSLGEQSSRC
jgi:hypothetical protein